MAWGCTGLLAFTVVYLGEHYVTDLIAGLAPPKPSGGPKRRCCHSCASDSGVLRALERVIS